MAMNDKINSAAAATINAQVPASTAAAFHYTADSRPGTGNVRIAGKPGGKK